MLSFLFWLIVYLVSGMIPAVYVARRIYEDDPDVTHVSMMGGLIVFCGPISLFIWLVYMGFLLALPIIVPKYGLNLALDRAEKREAEERHHRALADRLHKQLGLEPIDWKNV